MTIDDVKLIVGDTPYMNLNQARLMTDFIRNNRIHSILELGFAHGVSTCYMAAALEEKGGGKIVTIDLEPARNLRPNIDDLLGQIGAQERVDVWFEPTSYTWRLMKFLEEDPSPAFDLCYLDGAHSWFVDALAFFLVDRLLAPGGWIIFDDLEWTFASSPRLKDLDSVRNMPVEERDTPHVAKIYDLLVKTDRNYEHFRVENGWAFAQKRLNPSIDVAAKRRDIVTEQIVRIERVEVGIGGLLQRLLRKIARSLKS